MTITKGKATRMRYTITIVLATFLSSAATADVPRVVTDFGPIQSLVQQVMGTLGSPVVLLEAGSDPHDFQLKPSQAKALADAELIIWVGAELMPPLGDAISALAGDGKAVALLHDGGGKVRSFAGDEGIDPHGWLDPANASAWLDTIARELAVLDPQNASVYASNAVAARVELAALDAELVAALAPARGVPFVVFHDALGYFADHYGLNVAGAIELGDATTPSAARLREISAVLARTQAVCVFPEAGRDPKLIAVIVEGSTARVGAAQDIEAITMVPGPGLYAAMLRGLAATIVDCVQG